LLLEGVIAERPENDESKNTELGSVYRSLLREFLKWPLAKLRTEQFMTSLPPSFLQERALVLGRVGRHEDAIRILHCDLNSLDLALEYCDDRYALQKLQQTKAMMMLNQSSAASSSVYHRSSPIVVTITEEENAYPSLVRVALDSVVSLRGTDAAIKVLALRRHAVDHAAALRMLPANISLSHVARPFLIPPIVDGESQVRRMTIVLALLKLLYLRLKDKPTESQMKEQSSMHVVPALKSLNLGDPLHSTKSFHARTTSATPGSTMPYVEITKYFFPRHLVIQAKVTTYRMRQERPVWC
jgi:Vam6/Vps39-like protein vacuolar protein sorting-associated protein 39